MRVKNPILRVPSQTYDIKIDRVEFGYDFSHIFSPHFVPYRKFSVIIIIIILLCVILHTRMPRTPLHGSFVISAAVRNWFLLAFV